MSTSRWQYTKQRPKTELRSAVHGHTKHQATARHCPTCGCTPCPNPGFCRLCREADRTQAAQPKHDAGLPANWHEMSVGALWNRLNTPRRWLGAPRPTYDAALFERREYGITQLAKPNCQRRLAMLSPKQLEDMITALLRLRPRYQTITNELIATLREML
jgi:hypothetical protein